MSEFTFPADRFKKADATEEEITALVDEFDRSDASVQRAISEHFASVADGDIRDYLTARRGANDLLNQPVLDGDSGDSGPVDAVPPADGAESANSSVSEESKDTSTLTE